LGFERETAIPLKVGLAVPASRCGGPTRLFQALEAGASGYLVKPVQPAEIREAVAEVRRGWGADVQRGRPAGAAHVSGTRAGRRELHHLTAREHEIVDLVAKGYHSKEIAAELDISLPTVRTHLHSIYPIATRVSPPHGARTAAPALRPAR